MARVKLAPVLRYLVEFDGVMYSHPSHDGFTGGQTVWADPGLQFNNHKDAAEHAARVGRRAKVVKLRVFAEQEPVRRNNRPNLDPVPKQGDIAMMQGWGLKACPYPDSTVERMRWYSDWWKANADAFESHVYGDEA